MEQAYSAGAVSRPFWYVEFKKVVTLLYQGLTFDDIRMKVLDAVQDAVDAVAGQED